MCHFSAGFLCCYIPITAKPTTRGFVVTEKIVRELILANKFTRDLFGKKYLFILLKISAARSSFFPLFS
jgi:hypothetical protein